MNYSDLGFWLVLGISLAAFLFSISCYRMIRTILRHVLKFDPNYQKQIAEIHEETVCDEPLGDSNDV